MSPLTKAFVILTTVLSVLLVALIVPFVAQTQQAEADLQALRTEATRAQQQLRTRDLERDAALEQYRQQAQQAERARDAMAARVTELQGQLQDSRSGAATERAQMTDLRANLAQLSAAAQQDAQLLGTLREELNQARQELVQTRTQNIEQADRIVELQSQMAGLERQVRRVREQLVSSQEEAQRLQAQLQSALEFVPAGERDQIARGQQPRDVGTPTATPVQGQVTNVRESGGMTLVQVDIGSTSGIEEGNRLIVARGQEFVGTLVIDQVRDQQAAGRMVLQQAPVQAGDRIFGGQ